MKYLANSPSLPTEICKYMTHDLCATKVCILWEGGGCVEKNFPGEDSLGHLQIFKLSEYKFLNSQPN